MDGDFPLVILLAATPVAVGLVVLVWASAVYNRLTRLRQYVKSSWAGIDVELCRRYDLIPNLVAVVRQYAAHERDLLETVTRLRDRAAEDRRRDDRAALSADDAALSARVDRLLAVAEAYPDLKADHNFLELQKELAVTEDRIAASRRFYNGNVRELNTLAASFPTSLVARAFGFDSATYFRVDDARRQAPKVASLAGGNLA